MKRLTPVWEVIKIVVAVFVAAFIIRSFAVQPFIVDGSSMEPNFHNGEYLFVEKLSYDFRTPGRGEIVVFKSPPNPDYDYIKRVIGLPGETVRIQGGKVFINNVALTESYLLPGQRTLASNDPNAIYQVILGSGQFFVMGDNRDHSSDSREGWLVTKNIIIGRAAIVLYPSQNLHAIAAPHY